MPCHDDAILITPADILMILTVVLAALFLICAVPMCVDKVMHPATGETEEVQ